MGVPQHEKPEDKNEIITPYLMSHQLDEKVCITGSGGFIGGHLVEYLLSKKVNVCTWSRNDPMMFNGSTSIVHLAGRAHRMTESSQNLVNEYKRDNTDLTEKIAKKALQQGIKRFVFISTVKAIGEQPGKYRIEQTGNPTDPYGISKKEAERKLISIFNSQSEALCIIIRLPMVYGPGNKGNMLSLLKAARKKIPLPLQAIDAKRSMIYVKNVCDAIYTVLNSTDSNRPAAQTFYISDGTDISSQELYSQIFKEMNGSHGTFYVPEKIIKFGGILGSGLEKLINKNVPLNLGTVSRLIDEFRFETTEFSKDYGWDPPFSTETGIKSTVEWYLKS